MAGAESKKRRDAVSENTAAIEKAGGRAYAKARGRGPLVKQFLSRGRPDLAREASRTYATEKMEEAESMESMERASERRKVRVKREGPAKVLNKGKK